MGGLSDTDTPRTILSIHSDRWPTKCTIAINSLHLVLDGRDRVFVGGSDDDGVGFEDISFSDTSPVLPIPLLITPLSRVKALTSESARAL